MILWILWITLANSTPCVSIMWVTCYEPKCSILLLKKWSKCRQLSRKIDLTIQLYRLQWVLNLVHSNQCIRMLDDDEYKKLCIPKGVFLQNLTAPFCPKSDVSSVNTPWPNRYSPGEAKFRLRMPEKSQIMVWPHKLKLELFFFSRGDNYHMQPTG